MVKKITTEERVAHMPAERVRITFQPDLPHRAVVFQIQGADEEGEEHTISLPIGVSDLVGFDTAFHAAVDDLEAAIALTERKRDPNA